MKKQEEKCSFCGELSAFLSFDQDNKESVSICLGCVKKGIKNILKLK